MKRYFIPYETGIPAEMQELGFDEECMGLYNKTEFATYGGAGNLIPAGTLILVGSSKKGYSNPDYIPAPMFCQAQAWLRENHDMNLEDYQADSGNYVFSLTTTGANNARIWQDGNFPYFEALTKGIEKAIEIIKRRKNEKRYMLDHPDNAAVLKKYDEMKAAAEEIHEEANKYLEKNCKVKTIEDIRKEM